MPTMVNATTTQTNAGRKEPLGFVMAAARLA
jgi:hypothetical protein